MHARNTGELIQFQQYHQICFADPISFTLSSYTTIIPCNPVAPPRWNIDGHWCCTTPMVEPCGALKELEPKTREFKDKDFVTSLGGNIYSNLQIGQHQLAERIYHSREAQAIMGFYYANEGGNTGSDSIWWFRTGLSGCAVGTKCTISSFLPHPSYRKCLALDRWHRLDPRYDPGTGRLHSQGVPGLLSSRHRDLVDASCPGNGLHPASHSMDCYPSEISSRANLWTSTRKPQKSKNRP